MDDRQSPRFPVETEARLIVLSETAVEDRELRARIVDFSPQGCAVLSRERIETGCAVRLDHADSMILGEVVYCAEANNEYRCGIKFSQALNSLSDLAALVDALLREQRQSSRNMVPQAKLEP